MMFSMNLWSCLWSSIGILATNEISSFINFLRIYPHVMSNIVLLSLTGAMGQVNKIKYD
jgi:hypothetical protein